MRVNHTATPRTDTARTSAGTAVSAETSRATRATQRGHTALRMHPGFGLRQGQINTQVTAIQRAQAFLAPALTHMRELKSELSSNIAGRSAPSDQLGELLGTVQTHWRTRVEATQGSLDPSLALRETRQSRQSFRMTGFDLSSLQAGAPETVSLWTEGLAKPATHLFIDGKWRLPGEWARQLDRALASTGMDARLDDAGDITLSVNESGWPTLQRQCLIMGSGVRWPDGVAVSPSMQALPAAVDPENWRIGSPDARRDTLRQLVRAIGDIDARQSSLSSTMQELMTLPDSSASLGGKADAQAHAQKFTRLLEQPAPFRALEVAMATTRGLSAQRVQTVTR